jgi:hypothetical protein
MESSNNILKHSDVIINKLKNHYTEDEINNMDNELIENILNNIIDIDTYVDNFKNISLNNNNVIKSECIYINGLINNNNIKILIDTGANSCCINKEFLEKYSIPNIIENDNHITVCGVNSTGICYGIIKNLEFEIIDFANSKKTVKIDVNVISNNNLNDCDLILGTNFLKMTGAVINFNTMVITLNDYIDINF